MRLQEFLHFSFQGQTVRLLQQFLVLFACPRKMRKSNEKIDFAHHAVAVVACRAGEVSGGERTKPGAVGSDAGFERFRDVVCERLLEEPFLELAVQNSVPIRGKDATRTGRTVNREVHVSHFSDQVFMEAFAANNVPTPLLLVGIDGRLFAEAAICV